MEQIIVPKIYQYLIDKKKTIADELVLEYANICKYYLKRQLSERSEEKRIRGSNAGRCPRALAYLFHQYLESGKELDARSLLVFMYGDVLEALMVILSKGAGVPLENTGDKQLELSMDIDGYKIRMHPDATLEGKLVEFKSMNDFQFHEFEDGFIEHSYEVQANLNMKCLGYEDVIFVAINKQSGVLAEVHRKRDDALIQNTIESIKSVLNSDKTELVPAPAAYGPDPKKQCYKWNCYYCAYWKHCRNTAQVQKVGSSWKLVETRKEKFNASM